MYRYFTFGRLQFFKHSFFFRTKEHKSFSFLVVTSCTADPMDVIINVFWAIDLNHPIYILYIQSSSGYIS
uniref:Uncharacterized protein n=1 Tax=Arundo donax TaxID=35708 RepID=A0A0A9GK01_ARUDO